MTGSKYFFDTAPLIYLVEFNTTFYQQVSIFIAGAVEREKELVTSVISFVEFSIKPKKLGKKDIILKFEQTISRIIDTVEIDLEIADIASTLRAKYPSLRGMDSLQVASALKVKADLFITNDKRLKMIRELKIVLVNDL
jgi:predicted nucleic acid-binding protein